MGLLDWLSDAIGGSGSMLPPEQTTNGLRPTSAQTFQRPEFAGPQGPASPPMPPVQQMGADGPAPPQPPMPPMGPDSPQNPTGGPVPLPVPRPAGADSAPPGLTAPAQSAVPPVPIVPPNAAPTQGMTPPSSGPGPQARGILGRALGMDPNAERRLSGGLAQGLKAAGNSSGKSPFQALTSGAGATLEGQDSAEDKTVANQQKYIDQAIKAVQSGDQRELNLARTKLLEAQTKMTLAGKGGKDSVVNSDQQLYLRAQGATNQDANLKILKSQYDKIAMERGANSPEAKAAMDAYQKTYDETLNGHLGRLGLDPKKAQQLGKQPGMSQENPVGKEKLTSQEAFDKLPPGSWFVNPKDGKILQKPLQPVQQPGQQPAGARPGGATLPAGQGGVPAPTGSSLPPMPPKAPTSPVASSIPGVGADESDDEKEAA